jgi:heptaprenylglyceryl phosphate synthase
MGLYLNLGQYRVFQYPLKFIIQAIGRSQSKLITEPSNKPQISTTASFLFILTFLELRDPSDPEYHISMQFEWCL